MVAWRRAISLAVVALALGGCASVHNLPGNRPLATALPPDHHGSDTTSYNDDILVGLAFSGGGTRAAALSFGVMQELRDTRVQLNGKEKSLLDAISVISSVSGGSFTSAYYGLYGDRIFVDFEERFLSKHSALPRGVTGRSVVAGPCVGATTNRSDC